MQGSKTIALAELRNTCVGWVEGGLCLISAYFHFVFRSCLVGWFNFFLSMNKLAASVLASACQIASPSLPAPGKKAKWNILMKKDNQSISCSVFNQKPSKQITDNPK